MTDGEMSKKEKGKALEKRTRQFAVQMKKLSGELPNTEAGKVVKHQNHLHIFLQRLPKIVLIFGNARRFNDPVWSILAIFELFEIWAM